MPIAAAYSQSECKKRLETLLRPDCAARNSIRIRLQPELDLAQARLIVSELPMSDAGVLDFSKVIEHQLEGSVNVAESAMDKSIPVNFQLGQDRDPVALA